ncbi:chorismate mutase [Vagococcus zengguangii]|uniref:Chorismate mutase n=1 Tax=Vagococcus zengguangii TaxID=2571750 RepID=A0A4D7CTA1_9ENTE|nr:chorismate mutase [Vagococcus zengguangii]QCI85661.1 chorismate mutase [Vagococcus zengguangii]TLG81601.1 chorismate mutase [Vagococcus zengguangii]
MEQARRQIDELDQQIVALLEKRMKVVEQVIAIKQAQTREILDSEREEKVMEKVTNHVKHPQYRPCIQSIYEEILKCSKEYQASKMGK